MHDINFIRENHKKVAQGSKDRGIEVDVEKLLKIDKERLSLLSKLEEIRAKRNKASKEIARASKEEREKMIKEMHKIKEECEKLEEEFKKKDEKFNSLMREIPNIAFDDVPVGEDEESNEVLREVGKRPNFDFNPKDHLELGESLDIIDVKRASKTSGSRFGFLKGKAALIQFALINLAMETAIEKGFSPVITPVMLKPEMMGAMGFLERGADEIYFIEKDNLYLAGTSEQVIGPMHAKETFEKEDLPKRYIGYSTCFRREAGSYGKDTRGLFRLHQFDKVEMFSFTLPEKSKEEHQLMLSIQEELMKKIELPYRVVKLCTGDLGDSSAKTFDIETWMPGQNRYRETHSTSNCTDFQARRLNIRYREDRNLNFLHTLNGTAFAIGRIVVALIENNQRKDGSIKIPSELTGYLPFKEIK